MIRTENAQPAIFLVSWIACNCWRSICPNWNFQAAAGLSLGELTALDGGRRVFTFEDGLRIARQRGRFMQEACDLTTGGWRRFSDWTLKKCAPVVSRPDVEMADLNCPGQIVISGEIGQSRQGLRIGQSRRGQTRGDAAGGGGYHSRLMAGAQPKVEAMLEGVAMSAPRDGHRQRDRPPARQPGGYSPG